MSEEIKNTEAEETMADYADQLDKDPVWDNLEKMLADQTVITVEITGAVKAGVVTNVEGVRGFIPASHLDTRHVDDLEAWVGRKVDVKAITVEPAEKRLVLSAREVLKDRRAAERKARIDAVQVGTVVKGTVETIKDFGAFVNIGNGMSGLVHVSQISQKRVKNPADVLKTGDEVQVKIIGVKDGKISLSMKAVEADAAPAEPKEEVFQYKEDGKAATNLGSLLKGIKLN